MIYEVIHNGKTFEIDDNVFYTSQKTAFKTAFEESEQNDIAQFDNCSVLVFPNGKIVITPNIQDNE